MFRKAMLHSGGAATETLQLTQHLAAGIYKLTVSDGKNKYVQKVLKN